MVSPLFPNFRKEQRAALKAFRATPAGRIVSAAKVSYRQGSRFAAHPLSSALGVLGMRGRMPSLQQLLGTEWGELANIVKYKKPEAGLLGAFFKGLGTPGQLLWAFLSGITEAQKMGAPEELGAAIRLVQAFGGTVTFPKEQAELLGTPMTPAGKPERFGGIGSIRKGLREEEKAAKERDKVGRVSKSTLANRVSVSLARGGTRQVDRNHPVVTGEFVECHSSNVHSYAYDQATANLYVRFLGHGAKGVRQGRGALYRYAMVEPELFLSLHKAASKGGWVWDHLRIRGTVSGHQKDYELVGIQGRYVPRKATLTAAGEVFMPRTIKTLRGKWVKSSRPLAPVGVRGPR